MDVCGLMDIWMDKQVKGLWMDGCVDRNVDRWMCGWMYGWMNVWIVVQKDGCVD